MIGFLKYPFFGILTFLIFYFYFFNLGQENINEDQYRWYDRTEMFFSSLQNGNFSSTYQQYHPGVSFMYFIKIGMESFKLFTGTYFEDFREIPYNLFPIFNFHTKLYLVTATLCIILFVSYLLKDLYGKFVGLTFFILLTFDTYFIGMTRNLHMDGFLAVVIFLSIFSFYRYLQTKQTKFFWVTVVFSGLGLLTKSVFLIGILLMGLITIYYSFNHKLKIAPAKNFLIAIFLSFGIFCLFFPSMWANPIETLSKIYIQGALNTGLGGDDNFMHYVNGYELPNPGLKFYFHVLNFRLSPMLYFSILFIVFFKIFQFIKSKKISLKLDPLIVICFIFVVAYLSIIIYSSKKTDRYISVLYPPLVLLISYYLRDVWTKIEGVALKIFYVSFTVVTIFINFLIHPFYFAHYNPIFGGINEAQKRIYINQGGIAYLEVLNELENFPGKKYSATNNEELFYSSSKPIEQLNYYNFQELNFIKILPLQRGDNFIKNSKFIKNINLMGQPFWRIYE